MGRVKVKRLEVFTLRAAKRLGLDVAEALRCVLGERDARLYVVEGAECPDTCTCFSGEPYPETPCPIRWLGGRDGCLLVCEKGGRECIRAVKEEARTSSQKL